MHEHFTEALVLDNQDKGELDALITLYTRDFGKVIARSKSVRKITSKLSGHLQPLNFINARLIEKNGFQIVDALTIDAMPNFSNNPKNPEILKKNLNVAKFINDMTYELQEDSRLWQAIKKIFASNFEEKIIYHGILKIIGFDPKFAICAFCHKNETRFFIKMDHSFLCQNCGLKMSQNDVVFL